MDELITENCMVGNLAYMMSVLNDIDVAEHVIRVVTRQTDLHVRETVQNCDKLDVYATDTTGQKYDISIHLVGAGNASNDTPLYRPSFSEAGGEPMKRLSIVLIDRDMFGCHYVQYKADWLLNELFRIPESFPETIYINYLHAFSPSAIGDLIHDFKCNNPKDMYSDIIRQRARQVLASM